VTARRQNGVLEGQHVGRVELIHRGAGRPGEAVGPGVQTGGVGAAIAEVVPDPRQAARTVALLEELTRLLGAGPGRSSGEEQRQGR
jgi:hypothetical protein